MKICTTPECPTCGREMRAVTSRTPEKAWRCEACNPEFHPDVETFLKNLETTPLKNPENI